MQRDPYAVLGVAEGAEPEVIDAAYRALMKKYHPDRWRGPPAEGRERAQVINAAYDMIKGGNVASPPPKPAEDKPPENVGAYIVAPAPVPVSRNLALATGITVVLLAIATAIANGR